MPMIDSVPKDEMAEWRIIAQLAFNGWPDTFKAREKIAEVEKRDPSIAAAWDRVIEAILTAEIYDGVAG